MRRVLMVAYYFPPLGGIGSVRATKFATHLPEYGWEPTVLAPRRGAYFRDPELEAPDCEVLRSRSLELSRMGKRLFTREPSDTQPAQLGPVLALARDFVRRNVYFPDAEVGWYPGAVATALAAARKRPFDAIFSSSRPVTAHLVARTLHRRLGIPWVAEFRDPWSDLQEPESRARRAGRLEQAIATEATRIVVPSPFWVSLYARRWERDVDMITNGFDPEDWPEVTPDEGFVVTHVGSFYPGTQDLGTAWPALRELNGSLGPIRLRFVGEVGPSLRAELEAAGVADMLEVTGFVSHRRALELTGSSSVLLLSGNRTPEHLARGWISAKLFEYLTSGLPIVYLGDPEGDAAILMRRFAGCHVVEHGDVAGVRRALEASHGQTYERDLSGFTRQALTGHLAELLGAQPSPGAGSSAGSVG